MWITLWRTLITYSSLMVILVILALLLFHSLELKLQIKLNGRMRSELCYD